ncbi:hypothetical protein F5J12DRAFT_779176 [Pisolithus orientalis]|uniref:uncharacterized protein n=1 Tax=Pisolithus orientalis TaxID=936130 RepID=UPI002224B591|nr:uncharacterized protein F5J12DRAFT_779176 [Pisolithus orientalis]KAI6032730.1 hypothetical protein F5J12DRAFT_779176 [Pisolithus orientalis]
MRSFAALALLFTSVFAAPLSSSSLESPANSVNGLGKSVPSPANAALPGQVAHAPRSEPAVPGLSVPSVPGVSAVKGPSTSELTTRSTCLPSIACILNTVTEEIEPLVEELLDLVPANATVAIVTPILTSITSSLLAAVPKLEALVGTEISKLLIDVEGVVITVDQLAQIIFKDLELVLKALIKVLQIIDSQPGQIFDLLVGVLNAVLAILQVVVKLVGSIVASLGPLLAPFIPLIDCLGVTALLQLLGLSA